MSEVILGGVSLKLLAEQKRAIQKDAVKFIADGIKDATILMESIINCDDEGEDAEGVPVAAVQAKEILEQVKLVSDVSGVAFYLPFSENGYEPGDDPFSYRLETSDYGTRGEVEDLVDLLGNMEYDSRNWHSSTC